MRDDPLVAAFVPDGPLVVGVDETIERRRGGQAPTAVGVRGVTRWRDS